MPPLSSLARRAGCALARAPKSTKLQEELLPHAAAWEAPHCPSEELRHGQYPSHRWGAMGCSPAVLAATMSCRAVAHGWTSLRAAPLLTAPVPVIQLTARSPSDGRSRAAGTLP